MRYTCTLVAICYLFLTIDAFPFPAEQLCMGRFCRPQRTNSNAKCDQIDKYTVDWFIQNAPTHKKPRAGMCLFYTRGLTQAARSYAKAQDPPKTTIWDVWPAEYYQKRMKCDNRLRCIMQDKFDHRRRYFNNMSLAFASMCDVYAMVMDANITPRQNTFDAVNKAGIWFHSEFPVLQRGYGWSRNKVLQIDAISPDGKTLFKYWNSPHMGATSGDDRWLKKRSVVIEDDLFDDDISAGVDEGESCEI